MKSKDKYQTNLIFLSRLWILIILVSVHVAPPEIYAIAPFLIDEENKPTTEKQLLPGEAEHPRELLELANEFRVMRGYMARRWQPSAKFGVPDYADLVQKQKELLPSFRSSLNKLDPSNWCVHCKIDYLLLRAEMDKLEWELYVVRQTTRNPSFYVDQAIGNITRLLAGGRVMGENPILMPYSKDQAKAILKALRETKEILDQGRRNLTEIVPELADAALRFPGGGWPLSSWDACNLNSDDLIGNFKRWATLTAKYFPAEEAGKLLPAAAEAALNLRDFGRWLEQNRHRMGGKYYIGKDLLDWYIRHTFLMPYSSEELMLMAEMERARALSYLQFELHKNRYLPVIGPAKTTDEYLAWDEETALKLRRWYTEHGEDILMDQDYQPFIRSEECIFIPPFGMLSFPTVAMPGICRVQVVPADHWMATQSGYGWYTDPAVLQGHEYWPGHIYQAKMDAHNPCPIRRFHGDSGHNEGWAFYNEELLVALDFPFVRGPRSRELIYINMLHRAVRILIGIPLLTGKITPAKAFDLFCEFLPPLGCGLGVPREEAYMEVFKRIIWRSNDCFDAQTGKLQLFKLLADCKMRWREKFNFKEFHELLLRHGAIPYSLLRWEILGLDDEAKMFWRPVSLQTVLEMLEGTQRFRSEPSQNSGPSNRIEKGGPP